MKRSLTSIASAQPNSAGKSTNPASNTGFNSHRPSSTKAFTVGIDTLTLKLERVASEAGVRDVIALTEEFFAESIQFDPSRPIHSAITYDGSTVSSVRGTQVLWTRPKVAFGWGVVRLHLPGKALANCSTTEIMEFCKIMQRDYGATCARIDLCVDDHRRMTSMLDWQLAAEAGNFSGVRTSRDFRSRKLGSSEVGHTVYFGSPTSNKQLRVYDKTVESRGQVDAIRIEAQFRKESAQASFEELLLVCDREESSLGRRAASLVTGAVIFCDVETGDKNVHRRRLLPWYRELCAAVGAGLRLQLARPSRLLSKTEAWISRSVISSLAMLEKFYGPAVFWQFLNDEIEAKKPVLRRGQLLTIAQAIADDVRTGRFPRASPGGAQT